MKKNLLIIFLLISSTSFAQGEYNYATFSYSMIGTRRIDYPPAKKNKEVDMIITNKKSGKIWQYKQKFDKNARLTHYSQIKKGEEQLIYEGKFDSDGKKVWDKDYRRGKLKTYELMQRDEKGRVIKQERFGGKENLKESNYWSYNKDDCLTSSTAHKKDGDLKYEWIYEYYKSCERKRTILKNGKGKIKKEWTYDCKPEGEQLVKKKDVTQVCKWEEFDDKHILKITQSFDEKGRIVKSVSKYRTSDTSIVSHKNYDGNDQLTWESYYDYSHAKPLSHTSYHKGKERFKTIYKYENDNQVSYESFFKEKFNYKAEYKYNSDDLLIELASFNKKGEVRSVTTYNYN